MPSDVDDLFAEIGAPALTESMGETITQYPLGVAANAVTLAGVIVDLSAQGEELIEDEHGSRRVRRGTLTLAASAAVTVDERAQQRDTFLIRGLLWHAEGLPMQTGALQVVNIKRTEAISTKRTRTRG